MTVYKAYKPEAEQAAQLAVGLLQGKSGSDLVNEQTDNGMKDVPSVILTPVAVTRNNIADTVVKDGLWSVDQICTSAYADACAKAGLSK
jgi:D-xylose transport system substrate-binding protein